MALEKSFHIFCFLKNGVKAGLVGLAAVCHQNLDTKPLIPEQIALCLKRH